MRTQARERGQATVELALCLPLVALLLGVVVEVGLLVADRARLWQAAREAARVSAVDASAERVRRAAGSVGLEPLEVLIEPEEPYRVAGEPTSVTLRHRPPPRVPLAGGLVPRITFTAEATMRIEQP